MCQYANVPISCAIIPHGNWHIGILAYWHIISHIIFAFHKKGLTLLALISCRHGNSKRKRYGKTDIYRIS